jgi:arylsulfatase A-like enzyme
MGIGTRAAGAAQGLAAGIVAGSAWWGVETVANWAAGGLVPPAIAADLALLDLGVGALVGLGMGLVAPKASLTTWALGLSAVYGFLRVYAPPVSAGEAAFVAAAASAVVVGGWLAGAPEGGRLRFVQLVLLTTAAVGLGEFALDELYQAALHGIGLPIVVAALPLVAVVVDRALGFVIARPGVRLGLELGLAATVALVSGRPLTATPLVDTLMTAVPPPAGTPDVFVVVLDTTRVDHLSTYGYARDTSPHLTALAADALDFTQARSTAPWTLPGHASLFTGMYPSRHGARLAGGWQPGQSMAGRPFAFPLAADRTTLAEVLRDRGYQTAAFVANFSYLYRDYGIAQGFARYEDAPGLLLRVFPHVARLAQSWVPTFCVKSTRSAVDINAAALSWLDAATPARPVFAFLNYMEAHQPWAVAAPHDRWLREIPNADRYTGGRGFERDRAYTDGEQAFMRASYDGEVATMDAALGELVTALKARGRYENALIVVAADHGEFLGEHEQAGHMARIPYEPVLRVPLVVKLPGAGHPRQRIDTPVQLVDVMPTVLGALGIPVPADVQGEDLRSVTHPIVAEEDISPSFVTRFGAQYDRASRVLYDGPYKLLTTSRGDRMLFDLSRDPGEATDLAAGEPERVEALARRLQAAVGTPLAVVAVAGGMN